MLITAAKKTNVNNKTSKTNKKSNKTTVDIQHGKLNLSVTRSLAYLLKTRAEGIKNMKR